MEQMSQSCHTKSTNDSKFLHHLPSEDHISTINTGNGSIKTYKFIHIPLEIQNIGIQLRLLVCNSAAYTGYIIRA